MSELLGYIAYDTKLYKPGCVIVAVALGGEPKFAHKFPTELWLLTPTPDMKLYPVKDEEFLEKLVDLSILKNSTK